jgi:ABC-2 type transport system permease protein
MRGISSSPQGRFGHTPGAVVELSMTMLTDLRGMLRYKELIRTLVMRQIKIRYKTLALGYVWTILEPLVTMFVLSFVIGTLLKSRTENFSAYLLSGLIPWMFFNASLSKSPTVLITSAGLIKKIYFPREVLVLSTVIINFFNLLLSFVGYIPLMLILSIPLTPQILSLPLAMLCLFLLSFGFALILACSNVYFRETETLVRFVLRMAFFLTPIFYTIEHRVPERFLALYLSLNPLAVIIMSFRSALLGTAFPAPQYLLTGSVTSFMVFYLGYRIFKKNENAVVKRI